MKNKKNMINVGHNNKLMVPKPLTTLPLQPIETEKLLKTLLLTENGLKVKSKTPTIISNGLPTDSIPSLPNLSNLTSPDVKPTNSSSNNLKNTKMLLPLLKSLELNLPEPKPPEKLQYLPKLMEVSLTNLPNTNISSKSTP